jgi:RNA polymerase-binding transcription factor DksA
MAKAKKKAKAKAKKAKKVKKVARKATAKKAAKKKVAKKAKKIKAKKVSKASTKKVVAKLKPSPVKEEKVIRIISESKPAVQVKAAPIVKPEKEKKKTKAELADEMETLGEETYSWDSGTFSDMKNYEPTPVFRKPDPPQPKFKGKKDNRTRYSDKELEEFRSIINEKIAEAEKDYELLKNTLAHRDEHGTDDTSPTFKVLEDGSDAMSREEIAQLAARQEKHIQNLKNALIRIENKTYGICRVTGKLIPKERLRSVPHATLSIEAKLTQHS